MVYVNIHKSLYLQRERERREMAKRIHCGAENDFCVSRLQCYYYYHGAAFAQNSV